MPMPQIFRPNADCVARATLATLLIGPFIAIGFDYWTMRPSHLIWKNGSRRDQRRPARCNFTRSVRSISFVVLTPRPRDGEFA
jgi:hypothetical protein